MSCMASDANDDLNSIERLRWGDTSIKVYTRKPRKKKDTTVNHVSPAVTPSAHAAAAASPENNHVSLPILQTLEAEKEKTTEQLIQHQQDEDGVDLQCRGEAVSNDGCCGFQATLEVNGSDRQHNDVEAAPSKVVKPVICRVEDDRVSISLAAGARSSVEITDLRRTLETELDYVRNLIKKLEAKQLQLTLSNNGSIGAIVSHNYPQHMGSSAASVISSRSLVRVNTEVGSPRPFRRPSLALVVNNHVAGEILDKEKRTPKANPYYKNSEFLLAKDRLPSESKTNRSGKKKHKFGFGFDKQHKNKVYRSCTDLLERLMKHKHGWVFNKPVDAQALGLHDYHDIIKHPMDLGTIKTWLLSQNWYKSPKEFAEDVRLVFSNAMTYNPKGQDVHVMAEQLSQIFEERWAVIEAKYNPGWRRRGYHDAGLPTPTSRKTPHPHPFFHDPVPSYALTHTPQVKALERSESMTTPSYFAHVGRKPVPRKPKAKDPDKRDMTYEEKQKLSSNLENLPSEKLDAIVHIIKKRSSAFNQNNEEIEVDIDSVDVETLWELDRFVTNYRKNLSKIKRKAELALQARERAAQSAPITSSGPMVVDSLKESRTGELLTTTAASTHVEGGEQLDNTRSSSSSSSSSSDSGSSSSDSDSDSSSTGGSDSGH